MSETAAAWVDRLLPAVPYRQWVLSFRSSLSVRLGYDAHALSLVSRSLARHLGHDVSRQRRLSWARLLARVFSTDVTTCPCGGRLRPLGAVLTPDDIAAHLHGARAPPRPAPPGQLSLLP